MLPALQFNPAAIAAAVLADIVIAYIWYGLLFGKAWASGMKMPPDPGPDSRFRFKSVSLHVAGVFLTVLVLAHTTQIWRPSVWHAGTDAPAHVYGLNAAFWTWIGFYLPVQLGGLAWEGKSWKVFLINAGYHLLELSAAAAILSYWR